MHRLGSVLSLISSHARGHRDESAPWDLAGFRVSAEQRGAGGGAGGDFYTVAVRGPGRIGVVIGDACGRGLDGEAQAARILPRLRELTRAGIAPACLLSALNRTVIDRLPLDRFVTAAAFELDLPRGVLTVANAAHVPAIIRRAGRVAIVGRATGAPLGFSANTTYAEERHSLAPRDVILLMTDGVLEAVERDLAGMSTLRRILTNTTVGAAGVHRLVLEMFEECMVGRRADDMTLLALEPLGSRMLAKPRTAMPVLSCASSS